MLKWLTAKFRERRDSPLAEWSVRFAHDCIVTSDGSETTRKLPLGELRKVVVQTDDSRPWGADVVYYLFSGHIAPTAVFPLEAQGCDDFVAWLSTFPGYNDRELARAMGSTSVARFVVFETKS